MAHHSFNTAGPCVQGLHYMIPPLERLPEARTLVEGGHYFAMHAPRQVGKTTTMIALARQLTSEGKYTALWFSCEQGEAWRGNVERTEAAVVDAITTSAQSLPADLQPPHPPEHAPGARLGGLLRAWALVSPRPLVLFFDEIDALQNESLISVLRQLRAGFPTRPKAFPHSVCIFGLRDVRDYKAASGGDPSRLGTASPFNVKVESLILEDFTEREVRELFGQHVKETGQPIREEALARIWELTRGQPWLTNALGREITEKMRILAPQPIEASHVDGAKERLILARQTHLDQLVSKLHEPRVRRVIEPILAGGSTALDEAFSDDRLYVADLGLVTRHPPLTIANPIYREIIPRVLSADVGDNIVLERSFVAKDGSLDVAALLEDFTVFWRRHGDVMRKLPYREAGAQLVFMAFLQRVVNGGGYVEREYAIGSGRIDLCAKWPLPRKTKRGVARWQLEAFELKVWREKRADPIPEGLAQLDAYLARLGLDHGVLMVFDERKQAPSWAKRGARKKRKTKGGRTVTIVMM